MHKLCVLWKGWMFLYLLQFGEWRRSQHVTQMPTWVFVDKLTSTTVDAEGSKSVLVRTTGLEKLRITSMFQLWPLEENWHQFLFNKTQIRPKEEFVSGIIFQGNEEGWKAEEFMVEWLRELWKSRPSSCPSKEGILLVMLCYVCIICWTFVGIFQWHNPSRRTMALGSTQPLTAMSTRCFTGGKGCWCVRLTTLPPSCVAMKFGNLNFLEPSRPVTGLLYLLLICCQSVSDRAALSDVVIKCYHHVELCKE
jgi:hypothetical protein